MSAFPFDAVLFDCDGVLVDSETITNTVLAAMLGELGWCLTVDEAMSIFVGKTVMDEAPLIEAKTGVRITPAWLETFRERRPARRLRRTHLQRARDAAQQAAPGRLSRRSRGTRRRSFALRRDRRHRDGRHGRPRGGRDRVRLQSQ